MKHDLVPMLGARQVRALEPEHGEQQLAGARPDGRIRLLGARYVKVSLG